MRSCLFLGGAPRFTGHAPVAELRSLRGKKFGGGGKVSKGSDYV